MTLVIKNPPVNAEDIRDLSLIPGSGRSPGEGNDSSLQYFCLESSMGQEAWGATVHGVPKNQTWLSTHTAPLVREKIDIRAQIHKYMKPGLISRLLTYSWQSLALKNPKLPEGVLQNTFKSRRWWVASSRGGTESLISLCTALWLADDELTGGVTEVNVISP